ncbi:MAG: ARMT1-like domain-containing protein, partial [Candidatus Heimdallarchaeota archaeon]
VTDKFKDLLKDADLLIVKGQSNYETTLNNLVRHPDFDFPPIFCILRTKCKVITKSLGVPLGSNVIKQMHPLPKEERAKLVEIVEWKDC